MDITAAQVKQLRDRTGSGVMACKKALADAEGNMDAAIDILRKNGQKLVENRIQRIAAEGLCLIANDGIRKAAIVEVNTETDFAAQNDKFRTFASAVAGQALKTKTQDLPSFMDEPWDKDPAMTVKDALAEITSVIREKISIRRFEQITVKNGCVITYLHDKGRIGVIVDAKTAVVNDNIKRALTNIAMQVAAMSPRYISMDNVPKDFKQHEKEILLAQAVEENNRFPRSKRKPQDIIEMMVEGRLNKELKQLCLSDQVYIRAEDGRQTVAQYLQQVGEANGTDISIRRFIRYETGEGIEKKQENFAKEVMAQVGGVSG